MQPMANAPTGGKNRDFSVEIMWTFEFGANSFKKCEKIKTETLSFSPWSQTHCTLDAIYQH